ncbi:MAG: hypothetical protein HC860_19140 [Alkalinema sp. RU_4_3]|nr:hypothetical protein [Alkalinema sp. RU_4_3]
MPKRLNPLQIQQLQGIFKDIAPDVSLSNELIADRRQESLQDAEEWTDAIDEDACLHQAMKDSTRFQQV